MSNTCPTVKIDADNEQGFIIINESDFDAETQTIFGAEDSEVTADSSPDAPKRGRPAKVKE